MQNKVQISTDDVKHLAQLANLPIDSQRFTVLLEQIKATFGYIDTLQKTPTDKYKETNQVTGLHDIVREDVVDSSRTFSQEQALQNAPQSHKGYFMVPAILE